MEKNLFKAGFLAAIRESKRIELKERKTALPVSKLQRIMSFQPPPLDFAASIGKKGLNLIAEVKKASPSKGVFHPLKGTANLCRQYACAGASAISVVTEEKYFKGSLCDLETARAVVLGSGVPLLRKDFLLEPYHIYESRARGADAVLLIAALLDASTLLEMLQLSRSLGMWCLVETHNETELEKAIASGAGIIGINNRDLTTFEVDISTTARLMRQIPPDRLVVSESGIKSRKDIEIMLKLKVNAVLVGESLVTAPDVEARIRDLFGQD